MKTLWKKTPLVLAFISLLAALPALPGCASSQTVQPAPVFTLPDLNGSPISLGDFRGRPLLLNFWATWCPPCREEMPYLQEVFEKWADAGLAVLTVEVGESADTINQFLSTNGLTLPVVLDGDGAIARLYNVTALPTSFLVDRDGVIRKRVTGAFRSVSAIENQLLLVLPESPG